MWPRDLGIVSNRDVEKMKERLDCTKLLTGQDKKGSKFFGSSTRYLDIGSPE